MWHLRPRRAAASVSIRPSWPPPKMPTVPPGSTILFGIDFVGGRFGHVRCLARTIGFEALGQVLVSDREDRGGEERRVGRTGLADRERADGHAGGHLHDREEAIHAVERGRGYGHA